MPKWDRHVKTRRYAAVAKRLKGLARAGKSVVPGRSPIGFLPGDDVTAQDEQLVMMTGGVPCGGGCTTDAQCPDDGNPTCSVEKCEGGQCTPPKYPPELGSCPGDLGWSTDGMTPGTLAAVTCLEQLISEAGGSITKYGSGSRTQEYQTHLYNISQAYKLLQDWFEAECATARAAAINEKNSIHGLGDTVAPTGYHVPGTAFDITVSVPAGYDLDEQARSRCQIVRDVPNEAWHWHYIGG